jgi:hypothetical protein
MEKGEGGRKGEEEREGRTNQNTSQKVPFHSFLISSFDPSMHIHHDLIRHVLQPRTIANITHYSQCAIQFFFCVGRRNAESNSTF